MSFTILATDMRFSFSPHFSPFIFAFSPTFSLSFSSPFSAVHLALLFPSSRPLLTTTPAFSSLPHWLPLSLALSLFSSSPSPQLSVCQSTNLFSPLSFTFSLTYYFSLSILTLYVRRVSHWFPVSSSSIPFLYVKMNAFFPLISCALSSRSSAASSHFPFPFYYCLFRPKTPVLTYRLFFLLISSAPSFSFVILSPALFEYQFYSLRSAIFFF